VDCIHLAQDWGQWRALMNLRVPYKVQNFLTSWVNIHFSRRTLLHWGCFLRSWPYETKTS